MKYFICALITCILLIQNAHACCNAASDPENSLSVFLAAEFSGETDARLASAAFLNENSLIYGNKLNELTSPGIVKDLLADPIVIASGYTIECKSLTKKEAIFNVKFDKLGDASGVDSTSRLISFKKEVFEQKYVLNFLEGRWLVLNPSLLVVSLDSINAAYEERIISMRKIENLSHGQRIVYEDALSEKKIIDDFLFKAGSSNGL